MSGGDVPRHHIQGDDVNDLTELLKAVIANSDEDTPRLMYADALLERNRPAPAGNGLTDDRVLAERIKTSIEENWEPQRIDWTSQWYPLPKSMIGWYHRGFYQGIECTAEDFLRHADELLWHPGQTVKCEVCRGVGTIQKRISVAGIWSEVDELKCSHCRGRKNFARPCPPTAQPIRRVVLTTQEPWAELIGDDGKVVERDAFGLATRLELTRWTGVEFVLHGEVVL